MADDQPTPESQASSPAPADPGHEPAEAAPATPGPVAAGAAVGTPVPAGDHGHGHGHGHHNPWQGHHWDTMDQQCNAGKFGMWLFLATEVLLFAGLFCAYSVYRSLHPEVFAYASQLLDPFWGATNTVVLLISSFTVAMAVRSAQLGQREKTTMFLAITIVCAAMFMVVKFVEYKAKFEHHALWGLNYEPSSPQEIEFDPGKHHLGHPWATGGHGAGHGDGHAEAAHGAADPAHPEKDPAQAPKAEEGLGAELPPPAVQTPWDEQALLTQRYDPNALPTAPPAGTVASDGAAHETPAQARERVRNVHIFFGIYFIMTGTHGLHVIIGALAIGWVMMRNIRGDFSTEYNLPVDLVGLYWHLVDLIWIYLFPLLYLIDIPKWN